MYLGRFRPTRQSATPADDPLLLFVVPLVGLTMPPQLMSFFGLCVMLFLCWLLSEHRWKISLRIVVAGISLQFLFAVLILRTDIGYGIFYNLGQAIEAGVDCIDPACELVFGPDFREHFLVFKVLPIIIVFSALVSLLYYLGVMQRSVQVLGWIMQKTLGTSGAESLAAAANVFVGQNTAPLVARPYLDRMTRSELMTIMVGGFATIAGNVMAAYIGMGINAEHLLAASVISAPGALLAAKILQPETEEAVTAGKLEMDFKREDVNMLHAIARGANEGLKLALSVAAMLLAFVFLVTLANALLGWIGNQLAELTGTPALEDLTFQSLVGFLFWPLAWIMGFPTADCSAVSELLGLRFVTNEFLAYQQLAQWNSDQTVQLSDRSQRLIIYAMCGFANLGSIGVQIGGLGAIIPSRERDLAQIGFRAMLGGTLASFMGACVVGIIT